MLRVVIITITCLMVLVVCQLPKEGLTLDELIESYSLNQLKPIEQVQTNQPHPSPGILGQPVPRPLPDSTGGNNINELGNNPCGDLGDCVPFYQCANGSIITDGRGMLDIRFGGENGQTEQHPCKGALETCCTRRRPPTTEVPKPVTQECGFRNVEGVGFRITGNNNNEAQNGEFPWTVAILVEDQIYGQILYVYQCGGSLIHPNVVLTAAHCVASRDPRSLKIRAGEWDTQTEDEPFPHQDRNVLNYTIHKEYYRGGLFNDVALLFLDEAVQLAENVNTICLPPPNYVFDGSRCFASGWGKDLFGKVGKYQVILKRVELPIVSRDECLHSLRQTRLGVHYELHNSFICAGGERGHDTCKGDGGSPLVCPIPGTVNRYYQAGIVAWGIGCGTENMPGVYVNVPLFRTWIDEQLQLKELQ